MGEVCRENRFSLVDADTAVGLFRSLDDAGLSPVWQLQCGELVYGLCLF